MSTQHEIDPYGFTMTGGQGVYDLHWPEQNITIHVSHFSHKPLAAEVWVDSQRPNGGHITNGSLNLMSVQARNTFAKACADRDDGLDWGSMMLQLCTAVVRDYRTGEPEIELTGKVLQEVRFDAKWMAEPLLFVNNPTLLYGDGGSGKSYLAVYLSVLLGEGRSENGITITEPRKVLYLDWETDHHEISERIVRVRRGMGLDLYNQPNIVYKRMSQGLVADKAEIQSIVYKREIDIIVVDSVGAAVAGEPESAQIVLDFFGALRGMKIASLCIDHKNREGSIFGSAYKKNQTRLMFEGKNAQGVIDNKIEMALFHEKANNAPKIKPMGWVIQFDNTPDNESVTFERRDVKDTSLESDMTIPDRIENALAKGPKTVQQLVDELEKSNSAISTTLSQGKDKRFVNIDRGLWANAVRPGDSAFNEEL